MGNDTKSQSPLVSVVVVTMNNLALLRTCLESLVRQDYEPMEIILVDNGSDEDIQGFVGREFPEVRFIRLDKNQGFAGGNNAGITRARGAYVALINNDAVADRAWIRSMLAVAESHPEVGAVGSIVVDGHDPSVLDSCGVGIALDGMSRQAMRGQAVPELETPKEVLLFSGCACLLRMEALKEVGLFDEDFFAYCEDTDLGLRLRWAGWGILVAPQAFVYHYYSMTGGKYSLKKVFWVERNHFWVVVKNFPWVFLALLPMTTVWRYLIQAYALFRGRSELTGFIKGNGSTPLPSTLMAACWGAAKMLPIMLKKRRILKVQHRLNHKEMRHLIRRFRLTSGEIIGLNET